MLSIITRTDSLAGVGFSQLFLSVCYSTGYLKNRRSYRITKRDVEMFHNQSWKSTYFGVERSKVKVF